MQATDYIVLVGYFVTMIVIGIICSLKIKKQEDFFMGGRGFGKLLQTFAAFGAGTGAQDPINVGARTWTSGLSGIWSALMWLFVTPFYWIFAVWYRRMRHLTLGDWFVERYESQAMGAAYTAFGFGFYVLYLSAMFSAISKVAAPLLGPDVVNSMLGVIGSENPDDLKWILVPIIAVVVVAYGVVGGLAAAYWTDLIQGLCIIFLSLILIPYGLYALVQMYGTSAQSTADGFAIMHDRVPEEYFQLFGGPQAGEFPLHFIISVSLLSLVGIVVQPHFIATGGGSAKTENSARIGLVTGNFLKRFCTIGWALTGLIVLALLAGNTEIAEDPEKAWGVASREILGQIQIGGVSLGLVGLMLACLLAALMSSADCYMLVTSALLVRNIYAPYINPNASEKAYVNAGRVAGLLIIVGAVTYSLVEYSVLGQYLTALEFAVLFATPFWVGIFWRRATRTAAWLTMAFSLAVFFVIPYLAPVVMPGLRTDSSLTTTTDMVTTITNRKVTSADVALREGKIKLWQQNKKKKEDQAKKMSEGEGKAFLQEQYKKLGDEPQPLVLGDKFEDSFTTGGTAIFWKSVKPVNVSEDDPDRKPTVKEISRTPSADGRTVVIVKRYDEPLEGQGRFNLDFLLYQFLGVDLQDANKAMLATLRLPPRLITPFVVIIVLSFFTAPGSKEALDRYYVKMKTPVDPDREEDQRQLEESYENPDRFDHKKMFPGTSLEVQKPTRADVLGFVISVGICFVFLAIAYAVANIQ